MKSAFQPFDARKEFSASRRILPHWQQSGATYFVTFRLADSLPVEARERFEELRRLNSSDAFDWVERYLDAGNGSCAFSDPAHAMTVALALRYFDGMRYNLGAYVVMPNHVHALVQPTSSTTLTSITHSWKSYTAHELQRQNGITGSLWQEESFDRIVRDENELRKFDEYIFENPKAAHLKQGTFIVGKGSAGWLYPNT